MGSAERRTETGIHRYSYNRFIRKAFIITAASTVRPREEKNRDGYRERGQKEIEEQTRRPTERKRGVERAGQRDGSESER